MSKQIPPPKKVKSAHQYVGVPPQNEHEFQTLCHEWLERNAWDLVGLKKPLPLFEKGIAVEPIQPFAHYAVPNGAKTPGRQVNGKRVSLEALKLKREGLLSGVADYFVAVPIKKATGDYFHGLYIEFKFGANKQSEAQIQFQQQVTSNGYAYTCVYPNTGILNEDGRLDPLLHFKQVLRAYFGLK